MKDVAIKCVVTSVDGFYYREEHEWRNLTPLGASWLEIKMHEMAPLFEKFQNNKHDDGLTATLSATLDGALQTDITLTGISYQEMTKFQKVWHKWEGELLGFSERMAPDRDKKRGWRPK